MSTVKEYLMGLLVAANRLVNAALAGNHNMTISGRMGQGMERGDCAFCTRVCKLLHFFDKDHCQKQWRREKIDAYSGWM